MANWVTIALNGLVNAVRNTPITCYDKLSYDTAYTSIDFANGDLVNKRAVAAMIAGANVLAPISIPAGSSIPFLIDMTVAPYLDVLPEAEFQIDILIGGNFAAATSSKQIYDVPVQKDFIDASRSQYSQLQVFGHASDANPALTQDDLILLIR